MAAKKPTGRKSAAKKATSRKSTARRTPAKKASTQRRTTAKRSTAKKSSTSSATPKPVTGTIVFFDPATGRGAISTDAQENDITLDVATAKILNEGYVELGAGRAVKAWVDNDRLTAFEALKAE